MVRMMGVTMPDAMTADPMASATSYERGTFWLRTRLLYCFDDIFGVVGCGAFI